MPHRHERTIARRTAVQVLFAWEMRVSAAKEKDKAKITPHTLLESGELEVIEGPIDEYTLKLINGVVDNKEKIDGILEHMSRNWSVERMSLVDVNVIRVAIFEMMEVDDVTTAISIDEAVELAKGFGGGESHRFVNGILGAIAKEYEF